MKQSLGIEAKLVPGSGGIFDVIVDGEVVYSKFDTGRYPHPGELSNQLKS